MFETVLIGRQIDWDGTKATIMGVVVDSLVRDVDSNPHITLIVVLENRKLIRVELEGKILINEEIIPGSGG